MSVFIFLMVPQPEPVSPDDWVDAKYIAQRTGLAEVTILRGKAGTNALRPVNRRPMRWRRGDVDKWLERRHEAAQPKRISLVRRARKTT